jgi:hypothetical protein
MADCASLLTANILVDCDNLPIGGLDADLLIVNYDDVDFGALTFDTTTKTLCTNFQLKTGKVGFKVEGFKQSSGKLYSLVVKENAPNKYNHGIRGAVFNPTAAVKQQLQALGNGRFVAVVEQKWKGEDRESAFEILGLDSSLRITEMTNDSNANDNGVLFTLGSEPNFEEPKIPYTLLMTDYATTKTAFTNAFVEA